MHTRTHKHWTYELNSLKLNSVSKWRKKTKAIKSHCTLEEISTVLFSFHHQHFTGQTVSLFLSLTVSLSLSLSPVPRNNLNESKPQNPDVFQRLLVVCSMSCGCFFDFLFCWGCWMGCMFSELAAKFAFFPPSPPTYQVKKRDNGKLTAVSASSSSSMPMPLAADDSSLDVLLIDTKRGNKVVAFYLKNPYARLTLLYSHGNAADLGQLYDLFVQLKVNLRVNLMGLVSYSFFWNHIILFVLWGSCFKWYVSSNIFFPIKESIFILVLDL